MVCIKSLQLNHRHGQTFYKPFKQKSNSWESTEFSSSCLFIFACLLTIFYFKVHFITAFLAEKLFCAFRRRVLWNIICFPRNIHKKGCDTRVKVFFPVICPFYLNMCSVIFFMEPIYKVAILNWTIFEVENMENLDYTTFTEDLKKL